MRDKINRKSAAFAMNLRVSIANKRALTRRQKLHRMALVQPVRPTKEQEESVDQTPSSWFPMANEGSDRIPVEIRW